ncbi:hypothetical protein FACS189472_15830 [Alphaproteobacteria bacterium]|nr:hypothetical protein FACS189472_15830 [Alphaproteobacteria bacterium]
MVEEEGKSSCRRSPIAEDELDEEEEEEEEDEEEDDDDVCGEGEYSTRLMTSPLERGVPGENKLLVLPVFSVEDDEVGTEREVGSGVDKAASIGCCWNEDEEDGVCVGVEPTVRVTSKL